MIQPVLLGHDHTGAAVRLTPKIRSTHMHVIGATGQGKSRFLQHLIQQDIRHRHGVCLIDPHGELVDVIVRWCAQYRLQNRRRIHVIDPNSEDWTIGFNPLRCDDPRYLAKVVDDTVAVCAMVWGGEDTNKTPLLKRCLRAIFYALAVGGHPFSHAMHLATHSDLEGFRQRVTAELPDPVFQLVWDDLNAMSSREFREAFSSANNRLFEFLSSPTVRLMLSLTKGTIDLAACMEQGDIVLVNLRPDRISEDNARLIGTLFTNGLFRAALRRDPRTAGRQPFYLYIDECYDFLSEDVEAMLDQTRKFGLHVTLSHQHLEQLRKRGEHIYGAVMGNARTKVVFGGLRDEDATILANELLRSTFNFNRTKPTLDRPAVVGFETTIMRQRAVSRGRASTSGSSEMTGDVSGMFSSVSETYGADGLPLGSGSTGSGTSAITSYGSGSMRAETESAAVVEGEAEALRPILQTLPSAVEGEAEILNRAILSLRELPPRYFCLRMPQNLPQMMTTPEIADIRIRPSRVGEFLEASRTASPYCLPVSMVAAMRDDEVVVAPDEDDDPYSEPVQ